MADNLNITPDMINNFVNMLKNTDNNNNNSTDNTNSNNASDVNNNNNIDFNNLGNILSNFSSNSNSNNDSHSSNSNTSIDFETMLKIKSIMETMNSKNDPRSNLLYSLKPYLRESKRSKLDQYANLLKITQVTGLFKNEKES